MTNILTIESSCDETAAAVIDDRLNVLSGVVASQEAMHRKFGGVVPEVASRAHVESILPVVSEALECAGLTLDGIDAVAVANTPGLAGSLLVGLVAAKTLALLADKPLIAVNHLQAHIYACRVAFRVDPFPCVGLIVSGGHTTLYRCGDALDFSELGGTIDDAAGEAFDKVAAMLGLPYPGGPSIARCAENGDPKAHPFPRPLVNEPDRLEFSFSGLKTAVRYKICGPGRTDTAAARLSEQEKADLAASFQEAATDCLVEKATAALRLTGMKTLCVGGGVAANRNFREKMERAAEKRGVNLFIAPPQLCTDNAVMGAIAHERYRAGLFETLDLDINATKPNHP